LWPFPLKLELILFFSDPCCTRCKSAGFKLQWVRYCKCLFSANFHLLDIILIQIRTFSPRWLPLDIARMWGRHWLEQLLAPSSDATVPTFSHSNYLSLPLMSVLNIARYFAILCFCFSKSTQLFSCGNLYR